MLQLWLAPKDLPSFLQTYVSMGTGYLDASTPICMPSILSAMVGVFGQ